VIYAGTEEGLYASANGGDSWTRNETAFADAAIFSMTFGDDGMLYAGTRTHGVLRGRPELR
jgi:hypothetical protein